MSAYIYILRCSDRGYCVGSTRSTLEHRVAEHHVGVRDGHTKSRRPVELAYSEHFANITDAIAAEAAE